MGKSIVHCADCGKAIREDDYAKGNASIIDSRNYCSGCRAVSPSPTISTSRTLDLRKSSTSRLPLASGLTPRRGTPVTSGKSRATLLAAGIAGVLGLIALVGFALSRKGSPDPVDTASRRMDSPKSVVPAVAKPADTSKASVTPLEPSAADPKAPPVEPPKREAASEAPVNPVAKPGPVEKSPLPLPRLTYPQDGSSFAPSAEIALMAEAQDPQGRTLRVEFWEGTTKLGESGDVPYRFAWKGARAPGTYELKAKLIDRDGAESVSEGVRVTIKADAELAKAPPPAGPPAAAPEEASKDKPAAPGNTAEPKKEILPQVDSKKVDLAIKKGTQYLVAQVGKMPPSFAKEPTRICHSDELLLWTLIHAGVPESSSGFRQLFKTVTEAEFRRTYEVALQAMILEEVDRVRYQERIVQCAQFLADNQCPNGQWSYGEPPSKDIPTVYGALPVATPSKGSGASGGERQKPLVTRKVKVTPRRTGPPQGDNSNSQYAALGIRACTDAGVLFPDELLSRGRKWFRDSQHDAPKNSGVATGTDASAPPAGWCYGSKWHGHGPYGSMTAGAIGGLAIYDTLLGDDWRKDAAVQSGLSWLAKNFLATGNPGPPSEEWAKGDTHWSHFYYLYALERAGVLCRTEWMGRHAWYAEGVNVLLASQGRDGAWNESLHDTCFAILFLKRVTRPLEDVASRDERSRK